MSFRSSKIFPPVTPTITLNHSIESKKTPGYSVLAAPDRPNSEEFECVNYPFITLSEDFCSGHSVFSHYQLKTRSDAANTIENSFVDLAIYTVVHPDVTRLGVSVFSVDNQKKLHLVSLMEDIRADGLSYLTQAPLKFPKDCYVRVIEYSETKGSAVLAEGVMNLKTSTQDHPHTLVIRQVDPFLCTTASQVLSLEMVDEN